MCACRSKCTYWMGATAPQRCELFVNYFVVYLTGRSSYLGRVLPYAVMAMLCVYCLKGLDFSASGKYLPELLCTALVAGLHGWKRNTLLSIGAGIVAYMLLVQLVF